jgi:hypothetical protein
VNGKGKHNVEKDDKKPLFFNLDYMSKKNPALMFESGVGDLAVA